MFQWNERYEIGQPIIDTEHRELFAMLSRIGEDIAQDEESSDELEGALDGLLQYAEKHFHDEEQLMVEQGVDPRHLKLQQMEHQSFFYDIERLRSLTADEPMERRYERLLQFVTNWLVFHTLRTDQQLGIQLKALAAGSSAADAYDQAEQATFSVTLYRPIVQALTHLWSDAMERIHMLERRLENAEK
ncbi:bacteriohemerythrin [Haliea sp.]